MLLDDELVVFAVTVVAGFAAAAASPAVLIWPRNERCLLQPDGAFGTVPCHAAVQLLDGMVARLCRMGSGFVASQKVWMDPLNLHSCVQGGAARFTDNSILHVCHCIHACSQTGHLLSLSLKKIH